MDGLSHLLIFEKAADRIAFHDALTASVPTGAMLIDGGADSFRLAKNALTNRLTLFVFKSTGRMSNIMALLLEVRKKASAEHDRALANHRRGGPPPIAVNSPPIPDGWNDEVIAPSTHLPTPESTETAQTQAAKWEGGYGGKGGGSILPEVKTFWQNWPEMFDPNTCMVLDPCDRDVTMDGMMDDLTRVMSSVHTGMPELGGRRSEARRHTTIAITSIVGA